MCDIYAKKVKVNSTVKSVFREYIDVSCNASFLKAGSKLILPKFIIYQIAIDEDLGLPEAEKAIKKSFMKIFSSPVDQNMFDVLQNIFLQL